MPVTPLGLPPWQPGHDKSTEHARFNALAAKVNELVAAVNALPPPAAPVDDRPLRPQ
jgi:hypothetical protein